MIGNYKVITLCGSTKFKNEFIKAQKGFNITRIHSNFSRIIGHSGDDEVWTEGTKTMLDDMHKRKKLIWQMKYLL